jgi:hypothetical protein
LPGNFPKNNFPNEIPFIFPSIFSLSIAFNF